MKKFSLLFVGDSLIADFNWQSRMPNFMVHNYGVPGETALGLLDRLHLVHQEISNPDAILVMIGTNNLLIEDYSFTEALKEIITKLTNLYPGTEVIVNSTLPFKAPWLTEKTLKRINKTTETMTLKTGSCYLDMYSKFENSKDQLFALDGIHLTELAYDIWSRSILEFIAFLVED
ncbi:MAG: GDSL-type esterase/lipase family protein [Thermodesulfobacteriota bacterium]